MRAVAAQAGQHAGVTGRRRDRVIARESPSADFGVETACLQQGRGRGDRQQCHPGILALATDNARRDCRKAFTWPTSAQTKCPGPTEELAETAERRTLGRRLAWAEAVYGFFAKSGSICYVVGFTSPQNAVSSQGLEGNTEARTGLGGLESAPGISCPRPGRR
ncbi:hypothetical protein ACFVWY_25190 [Streptomyces sp. NPDC058195]|uniref:hypothetical protein n=1 Tax=Streptomyces sp. NPDC058195 TaxID=3346375 RepID=UPI0036E8CD82